MADNREIAKGFLLGASDTPAAAAQSAAAHEIMTGIPASVGMQNPAYGADLARQRADSAALANSYIAAFAAKSPAHAAAAKDELPQLDTLSSTLQQTGLALISGLGSFFITSSNAELLMRGEDSEKYALPTLPEVLDKTAPPKTELQKNIRTYVPFAVGAAFGPEADAGLAAQLFTRGLNVVAPAAGFVAGSQGVKALGGNEGFQNLGGTLGALVGGFGAGARFARGIAPIEGETNGALYGQRRAIEPDDTGLYRTDRSGTLIDPEGTPYKFKNHNEAALWGIRTLDKTYQNFSVLAHEDGTASIIAVDNMTDLQGSYKEAGPARRAQDAEFTDNNPPTSEGGQSGALTPEDITFSTVPRNQANDEFYTPATPVSIVTVAHQYAQDTLTKLTDLIGKSPLYQNSPTLMKEFLDLHGLNDTDLHVDAEKFVKAISNAYAANDLSDHVLDEFYASSDYGLGGSGEVQVPVSKFLNLVSGRANKAEFIKAASLFPNIAANVHPDTTTASTSKTPDTHQSGPFDESHLAGGGTWATGNNDYGTKIQVTEKEPGKRYLVQHTNTYEGNNVTEKAYETAPEDLLRAVNTRHTAIDPDGRKVTFQFKKQGGVTKAAAKAPVEIPKVETWKQVAAKPGGAQPGAIYEDPHGVRWLVKGANHPNEDQVRSEVLAADLMRLAGTPAAEMRVVELGSLHGGGLGVASRMMELETPITFNELSFKQGGGIREDFAIHAWVGNRDWAGPPGSPESEAHNAGLIKGTDSVVFFDTGGSLFYTGLGALAKHFDSTVREWEGLQDFNINPTAASFFHMPYDTDLQQLTAERLLKIQDSDIRAVVEASGVKLPTQYNPVKGIWSFVPGTSLTFPKDLPALRPWVPPTSWQGVDGIAGVDQPSVTDLEDKAAAAGKTVTSGIVVIEPDGRFWIAHPKGGFGGYEATFAKGTVEGGLGLEETAVKETWEELGIHAQIKHHLGDFERPGSFVRLYVGKRLGGNLHPHWESEKVSLVSKENAKDLLNQWHVDGPVVEGIKKFLNTPEGKELAPGSGPVDYAQVMIDRKYSILQKAGVVAPDQVAAVKQLQVATKAAVQQQASVQGLIPSSGVSFDKLFSGPAALLMGQRAFDHYNQTVEDALAKLTAAAQNDILVAKAKTNYMAAHTYQLDVAAVTDKYMQQPAYKAILSLLEATNKANFYTWADGKPRLYVHYTDDQGIGLTPELEALWNTGHKPLGAFKPKSHGVICFKEIPQTWDISQVKLGLGGHEDIGLPSSHGALHGNKHKYFAYIADTVFGDFRIPGDVDKAVTLGINTKNKLTMGHYTDWEPITKANPFGWNGTYMLESHSPIEYSHNSLGINVLKSQQVHLKYMKAGLHGLTTEDIIKAAANGDLIDLQNDGIKINLVLRSDALLKSFPKDWFSADGLSLDELAAHVGAGSGDALALEMQTIMETVGKENFKDWLQKLIDAEAQDEYDKQVGGIVNPRQIQTAAETVLAGPKASDLLIKQYAQLAPLAQQRPLEYEDLMGAAEEDFEKGLVKYGLSNLNYVQESFKQSRNVEDALIAGDALKAFKAKQKQILALMKHQLAIEFQKKFPAEEKDRVSWGTKKQVENKLDPIKGTILQKVLKEYKYPVERSMDEINRALEEYKAEGKIYSLETYVAAMKNYGIDIDYVAMNPVWAQSREPVKQMPIGEYESFSNMLKALHHQAEFDRVISDGEKKIQMDTARQEVVDAGGRWGGKIPAAKLVAPSNRWEEAKSLTSGFFGVGQLRFETWLSVFDDAVYGPMQRLVLAPAYAGQAAGETLKQEFMDMLELHKDAIKGFSKPDVLADMRAPGKQVVPIVTQRGDRVHIAIGMGEVSWRQKFLKGYELDASIEKEVFAKLTPQEERFVVDWWAHQEKLFELSDSMNRDTRGYGIKKERARNVTFKTLGKHMGGHVGIKYDRDKTRMLRAAQLEEDGKITTPDVPNDVIGVTPVGRMPHNSYTLNRKNNFAAPIRLDINALHSAVVEMIHDITMRPALIQMQKILHEPIIAQTIAETLGREYQAEIDPWLSFMAQHDTAPSEVGSKVGKLASTIVNNEIAATLAFKIVSAVKHPVIAAVHIGVMLNPGQTIGASIQLHPFRNGSKRTRDFVRANSSEVQKALRALPSEYFGGVTEDYYKYPGQEEMMRLGYMMMSVMRVMQSEVAWLSKYNESMADVPDHGRAAYLGDKAVRDVMGSFSSVDTPPLYRAAGLLLANAFLKSDLEAFMGLRNAAFGKNWVYWQQAAKGVRQIQGDAPGGAEAGRRNIIKGFSGAIALLVFTALAVAATDTLLNIGQKGEESLDQIGNKFLERFAVEALSQTPDNSLFGSMVTGAIKFGAGHKQEGILEQAVSAPGRLTQAASEQVIVEAMKRVVGLAAIPSEVITLVQFGYDQTHPNHMEPQERTGLAAAQRLTGSRSPHLERGNGSRGSNRRKQGGSR